MTTLSDACLIRTLFGVRIREIRLYSASYTSSILFQLITWNNKYFLIFFEIVLVQTRKLDPMKSFKYHKHQLRGNKVRTSFDLFALTSAFFIFNPGYNLPYRFFITPHGMLVLLFFFACLCKFAWGHGEISYKWLLAEYETFRWSVVRASHWYLGYNGLQCFP